MELMVITRPDFFEGESEAIRMLLDEGLEFLHIRKPVSTPEQVEQLLKQIPGKYYNRIVLHEHVDLALRYELRGFHVNRRTTEHVPYYKWEVSTSVHSLEELKKKKGSYEYLFLSPVFDSISKTGYHSAFTPGQLRQAREHFVLDYGIIALGGVTADRVGMLRMLGFGGVAVLGDVWDHFGQPDFLEHFRQLLRATNTPPVVLTVAGSDSSGGAGIQADIKTLSGLSAYATSVITAVTAQNTLGVQDVFPVPAPVVRQQLESVLVDLPVAAIKIGMVPNASVAQTLAEVLSAYPHLPVVCDPVMVSTSGRSLMEPETIRAMEESVFPRCTLLTPNLPEASLLLGHSIDDVEAMKEAAMRLASQYGARVLLKGGHLPGNELVDVLGGDTWTDDFHFDKITSSNLHGTGCTLSSAIAAYLAAGFSTCEAITHGEDFTRAAIRAGRDLRFGHGNGPLWHFFSLDNDLIWRKPLTLQDYKEDDILII